MPISIPTHSTLIARITNDILSRLESDDFLRRSDGAVYARVNANGFVTIYDVISYVSKQILWTTADSEYLDLHASMWLANDPRRQATRADGPVTVSGSVGGIIEAGQVMTFGNLEYAVIETVTLTDSTGIVQVQSVEPGSQYNLPSGQTMVFAQPINNVTSTGVSGEISSGTDLESDESLRERISEQVNWPPAGGNDHDYIRWAKEVPGVTRAWVVPGPIESPYVYIYFMRDGDTDPIPDADDVAELQAYLDSVSEVTAIPVAVAPDPIYNDIEITLIPDDTATRAAVVESLKDFYQRESEAGGMLYLSRLSEAVSSATGESHHYITSPTADIPAVAGKINMLGDVIWNS